MNKVISRKTFTYEIIETTFGTYKLFPNGVLCFYKEDLLDFVQLDVLDSEYKSFLEAVDNV